MFIIKCIYNQSFDFIVSHGYIYAPLITLSRFLSVFLAHLIKSLSPIVVIIVIKCCTFPTYSAELRSDLNSAKLGRKGPVQVDKNRK